VKVDFVKKRAFFKKLFHSSGILEILFSLKWVFLNVFFIGMLFSSCGIPEMLSFSEVDFIRLCFLYGYFVQCELWVFFACIFQNGHIGNLSSSF